jgi:hypothetical protein
MNIKLILFPNSLILISQIEEVVPDEIGEPDCKIVEPFIVNGDFLEPWLIEYSNQNVFMMHSDKFLTIADPNPPLLEKYKELIK